MEIIAKGAGAVAAGAVAGGSLVEAQNRPVVIPTPEGQSDLPCGGPETFGELVNLAGDATVNFDDYFATASEKLGIANPLTFVWSYDSRNDGTGNTTFRDLLDQALSAKGGIDANNIGVLIQHEAPQLFISQYQEYPNAGYGIDQGVYMNHVTFVGSILASTKTRREIGNESNQLLDTKITPTDENLRAIVEQIALGDFIVDETEKSYLYARHIADYFLADRVWSNDRNQFLVGTNITLDQINPGAGIVDMTHNIEELSRTNPTGMTRLLRNIINYENPSLGMNLGTHHVKLLAEITQPEIDTIEDSLGNTESLRLLLNEEVSLGMTAKLLVAWIVGRIDNCHNNPAEYPEA